MGGVTPAELEKRLSANDIANGWANRFLWFHSQKREGGFNGLADDTLRPQTAAYLKNCISFGQGLAGTPSLIPARYTMRLSTDAYKRLEALTDALDIEPIGAMGALAQRMPGHIVRLAMVAAVFDQSDEVTLDHVRFGEAMTAYALDSMRSVFGMRVDDDVAMLVLEILAQVPGGWMGTNDLRKATGNKDHARLMKAVRVLLAEGLVVREERPTAGRPSVGYRLRRAGNGL
jgi:DNA-binding HxlR family transcriptional regulator